jgi:hypothetical protein
MLLRAAASGVAGGMCKIATGPFTVESERRWFGGGLAQVSLTRWYGFDRAAPCGGPKQGKRIHRLRSPVAAAALSCLPARSHMLGTRAVVKLAPAPQFSPRAPHPAATSGADDPVPPAGLAPPTGCSGPAQVPVTAATSLGAVASQYRVSIADVQAFNGLTCAAPLTSGQSLTVDCSKGKWSDAFGPGPAAGGCTNGKSDAPKRYVCPAGEYVVQFTVYLSTVSSRRRTASRPRRQTRTVCVSGAGMGRARAAGCGREGARPRRSCPERRRPAVRPCGACEAPHLLTPGYALAPPPLCWTQQIADASAATPTRSAIGGLMAVCSSGDQVSMAETGTPMPMSGAVANMAGEGRLGFAPLRARSRHLCARSPARHASPLPRAALLRRPAGEPCGLLRSGPPWRRRERRAKPRPPPAPPINILPPTLRSPRLHVGQRPGGQQLPLLGRRRGPPKGRQEHGHVRQRRRRGRARLLGGHVPLRQGPGLQQPAAPLRQ